MITPPSGGMDLLLAVLLVLVFLALLFQEPPKTVTNIIRTYPPSVGYCAESIANTLTDPKKAVKNVR